MRAVHARHGISSCATQQRTPHFPVRRLVQKFELCRGVVCGAAQARGMVAGIHRQLPEVPGWNVTSFRHGSQEPNGCWLPLQASSPPVICTCGPRTTRCNMLDVSFSSCLIRRLQVLLNAGPLQRLDLGKTVKDREADGQSALSLACLLLCLCCDFWQWRAGFRWNRTDDMRGRVFLHCHVAIIAQGEQRHTSPQDAHAGRCFSC